MKHHGKWLSALVTAGMLVALSGCSGSSGQPSAPSQPSTEPGTSKPVEKQTVTMLYWPGPESDAMQKVVDHYNQMQGATDGVEVKMAPAPREGFWEKEAAMMGADNKDIDVYFTASYKIGEHKDDLLPLDEKLGDSLKLYIGTTIDSLKNGGQTYAIPTDVSNHFMYYRKDLIDRLLTDANWQAAYKEVSKKITGKELVPKKPEEWNWDDFTATAAFFTQSIHPDSPTQYGTVLQAKNLIYNVMIWDDILYSLGGSWYTSDGKANFDTPETRKALEVYASLTKNGISPAAASTFEYPETNQAFQSGKAAMILQWSAAYHELTDQAKSGQIFDKVGIAPIPGDQHKTHVHSLGVGINKHSDKQEASLKWMKYLATKEAMQTYAENGGIPPVADVLNGMKEKRPEFPAIAQHVDQYGYVVDTSEKVFPILEVLARHFSAVWAGQADADAAAKNAQAEVTTLLGK
ncbi:sugar ABC transporter substrate-binding protein [Brevibacillus brevis]|uniref:Sugar ABC transporter substrate-binding protein n=1 Tax=Brevibacillus brevis TaxID=1393 RepID=A0ABY9TE93_BREBE|nr:sugar ABC transporter substrate-binding protein [Brevibacillus brevis]WNC17502.1 sugar ABC transporter substrate-binding protein [Brevibacillus brevis]